MKKTTTSKAKPAPKTKPATKTKPASKKKKASKKKPSAKGGAGPSAASRQIDQRIRELGDWRGQTLAHVRSLILAADPGMTEEWKWENPVWSHDGIVCTGESYKKAVKLTFARGAFVPDPKRLFNSSLEGNLRRAIDIPEGAKLDAAAFKALIKAAVLENSAAKKKR